MPVYTLTRYTNISRYTHNILSYRVRRVYTYLDYTHMITRKHATHLFRGLLQTQDRMLIGAYNMRRSQK